MTNEQLASIIQQDGESSDLLPVLWNRVKKLCFMFCDRFYNKYADSFTACGCDLTDCRQESYFAFIKAVKAYKPEKDFKLSAYLNTWIKQQMRELLGIHNAERINRKPLDNAASLDAALPGSDEDKELSLHDVIEDNTAQEAFESLLDDIADEHARKIIEAALNKLEERERKIIVLYFFKGSSLVNIGQELNTSTERARQLKAKAIKKLRTNTQLKVLYCEERAESALHLTARASDFQRLKVQGRINHATRFGEVLTKKQKENIIEQHKTERACESDPVYIAFAAIANSAEKFGYISAKQFEDLLTARTKKAITEQEQARGRSLSYGEAQAIRNEQRLKLDSERAKGFGLNGQGF